MKKFIKYFLLTLVFQAGLFACGKTTPANYSNISKKKIIATNHAKSETVNDLRNLFRGCKAHQ